MNSGPTLAPHVDCGIGLLPDETEHAGQPSVSQLGPPAASTKTVTPKCTCVPLISPLRAWREKASNTHAVVPPLTTALNFRRSSELTIELATE